MKKFLLHISFLTLLCMVLANCRHDPDPEPESCEYDSSVEEMKKWYYFKTGTWWVYQEQTTGDLDTVTVYYDWEGQSSGGFDGFEWYGSSSYDGFNYKYRFNASFSIHCITRAQCNCNKVNRSKTQPGNFVGDADIFLFPMIKGNYNNIHGFPDGENTSGTTTLTDTEVSMTIDGNVINEIVKWNVTTDQSIAGYPSIYSIAKNIGIVQMEFLHSSENWSLVEFNIIQ